MQPLFAPSSVQLLDGDRSVLFTLADGSRHEARLIPSARARNLRLRLSPDKGLLLTVPAGIPATALPALLFSFLPWLERHLPACSAPAPLVLPEKLLLPLRGTALQIISDGPLSKGRRQTASCTEPPLLLRAGSKRLLALVRDEELRLYAAATPEDAVLLPLSLLEHLCWHELCHLPHMDHSPAYRQTLARFSPDWKLQERRLTAFWRDLPVWARPCPSPAPDQEAGRTALQAQDSPV